MKRSKSSIEWNKVTPFSKYLAMALFILLPFAGFGLGMKYQQLITIPANQPGDDLESVIAIPNRIINVSIPSDWKTYRSGNLSFRYPKEWITKSSTALISKTGSELNIYENVMYVDSDCQQLNKEETVNLSGINFTVRYYSEGEGESCVKGRKSVSSFVEIPNSNNLNIFIFRPSDKFYEEDVNNFLKLLSTSVLEK